MHLNVGLAGFGNVGTGVYTNLEKNRQLITERAGAEIVIQKIAVRDPNRNRDIVVPPALLAGSWQELVDDPGINTIVELIGGTDEALKLVRAALSAGKIVVTGNKALLAEHGLELIALAEKHDVPLYFEAAVAGGIPIIKAVREALVANRIEAIHGILNGTSNFILSRMTNAGLSFDDALIEAQAHGFAEADPTLDVNGWDAGHKAIILAWLSYGQWVNPSDIHVSGIDAISPIDIAFARRLGYEIKLVAVVKQSANKAIEVRVQPSLLSQKQILSSVDGVFNAVAVRGDVVGDTLFYGSGAGRDATSSSVIADLVDATSSDGNSGFAPHGEYGQALPIEESISHYYLRTEVKDEPGTLAAITSVLAQRNIGVLSAIQPETRSSDTPATLVFTIHTATYGNMMQAVTEIAQLPCSLARPVIYRIEVL